MSEIRCGNNVIRFGRAGKDDYMKHRVTVKVETKKHFLGIPYKTMVKKRIEVDGKTYRKMKQAERERQLRELDATAAAALVVLEEEECI